MVDYLLQGTGRSVVNMPEFDPSILTGDIGSTPSLQKAPPFIKDTLVFPYFSGMTFTAAALKPDGWRNLAKVFANPPASTQQILHPSLYRSGHVPERVTLPSIENKLGKEWKKLDESLLGEFGWLEVLKQYLNEAEPNLSPPPGKAIATSFSKINPPSDCFSSHVCIWPALSKPPVFLASIPDYSKKNTDNAPTCFVCQIFSPSTLPTAEFYCAAPNWTASAWRVATEPYSSKSTSRLAWERFPSRIRNPALR